MGATEYRSELEHQDVQRLRLFGASNSTLYEPTPEVLKKEELALRRLMSGPRKWITRGQILTLSAWSGFISGPQSLHNVALAAKHRLMVSEP